MSAVEETLKKNSEVVVKQKPQAKKKSKPILNSILDTLSSVTFGVSLLVIAVVLSMIGMLIVQQNVDGFELFFAGLTPSEKLLYGTLGFFDIYHSWYFNLLLLVLSLNIVLASIDHFPKAWAYISTPKLDASKAYLLKEKLNSVLQSSNETTAETTKRVTEIFKKNGLSAKITEKGERRIVFGEKNVVNRLGAYIVHVALLTLFLGHFVALQTGHDADVRLMPGMTTDKIDVIQFRLTNTSVVVDRMPKPLPFTVTCTDIQQTLVDAKGSIEVNNTLDWFTRFRIDDPTYGSREVSVSLNQPYTYRGYRFFQASAITQGSARSMNFLLTPENGGSPFEVKLQRNGSTTLPDGTKIEYIAFFPDFVLNGGQPDTKSPDYNNPAVQLKLTSPSGETKNAFAFGADLPSGAPIGAPIFGNKYKLASYEKSPLAHVLSIKYDPFYGATIAWYIGGGLLMFALCFVFFLAHQRVWAIVENGEITLGGNANRNEIAFKDKFEKIVQELKP